MNVEFNSGGLQVSISSWMHNLSVYFKRVLVMNLVACSIKGLLERGIYYILVSIVVCLEMHGELLILVVQTIVRVFLQMSMVFLKRDAC